MTTTNYFTAQQEAWLFQKLGKVSSSNCYHLWVGGKRPITLDELAAEKAIKGRRTTVDTMFGAGALTYLLGLVDELTTGVPKEEMDFKQCEYGKANELDAILSFEQITGLRVEYHGIANPEFIKYGDFAGGSPDGKVINENSIVECKCHFDGAKHMRKLLIKSVEEFKEEFNPEWHQDQMNMLVTDTDHCYSISYDPRKQNPKLRLKIIKIPKDLEWQEEFKTRLNAALEIMSEMIENIEKYLIVK